jgi:hypothetical protein
MREKLAYVETIRALTPIPKADKIERAEILGWEIVVKKGDFSVGDKCVYAEIDSIFPDKPSFEFLKPRKMRIRTVRLRGQISQGICFPLSIINEIDPAFDISKLKVGDDLTSVLGISKYDPESTLDIKRVIIKKSWLQNKISYLKWKLFSYKPKENNDFPAEIPKTDEFRVQHMTNLLERRAGAPVYITEKCEGTSSTFVFQKTSANWLGRLFGRDCLFQMCSRNRVVWSSDIGGETNHHAYYVAKQYDIFNVMKNLGRNLAIQGEIIGTKANNGGGSIQGNIYKLNDYQLRVFSIYDLDKKVYLPVLEMWEIIKELNLEKVPTVGFNHLLMNDIKYYVELSKGKSMINPDVLREGIVVRALDSSFSFKAVNPEYLLHQELMEK